VSVPPLDLELGLELHATKSPGISGVIREEVDDFVVQEVLVDGSKAPLHGEIASKVLGSSLQRQRFLLCVLVKRNWDTFIAVKNVAIALGIDQNRIQIAGIKDAKAITAQHLTIDGSVIEEVAKVKVKDINVYPVGYIREALSTYYLHGNNFTINIRATKFKDPEEVATRVFQTINELVALGGMPNYYGHQRFGTTRPITHLVGKALVQGNFEDAAMLFLAKPSPHEHPASRQARQQLQETMDFPQAMINFPRQLRFERLMLSHLFDCPGDYIGAFQRLPLKLQELFVQAYQSYLFNRFLSERLKRGYSLNKAEIGDYVIGVERNGLPLTNVAKIVSSEVLASVNEQVRAGKMRVALPIVSLRQKQSQGVMGEIERGVIEQEGVNFENLRLNVLSRMGGKGGLRAAVTPIRDFKITNISCNDEVLCAQLSFMLFRGSYATVLLREVMKPLDLIKSGF
jgi:tRNA pseudouridine13 synthase